MSPRNISPELRNKAELQYAEIVGRLYACEQLENGFEKIEDHRVLYGWGLLAQEVLMRLAEASLKLLFELHTGNPPRRTHNLEALWKRIPAEVRKEVETERGEALSFTDYDNDAFQDVRYFADRRGSGQTVSFEARRLYLDSLAATNVVKDWLGEITIWPWAGLLDKDLGGYRVLPINDGKFDVWIDDPIEPMEWAGAIIEPKDSGYVWTLYFGFTDDEGNERSCRIPSLHYPWPLEDLIAPSVVECVEQIRKAYQEPCHSLVQAIEQAHH